MTTTRQPTLVPPNPALPAGFFADQGALYLNDEAYPFASDPFVLASAIVTAAECDLHVPQDVAKRLSEIGAGLKKLPPRRRGEMLAALVMSDHPSEAIDLAVRLGVLKHLLPDIDRLRSMPKRYNLHKDVYSHTLRVVAATQLDLITRLAALMHDVAKPDTLIVEEGIARFPNHDLLGADRAGRRMRVLGFEEKLASAVETLVRLHIRANSYEENWTDSAVRRLHLDAGDQWQRLLDLSYADVTSARSEAVARARRRVQNLADHAVALEKPVETSPLDGTALMERFGKGPGRWIGEIKQHLIEMVRTGELAPDDEAATWRAVDAIVSDHK